MLSSFVYENMQVAINLARENLKAGKIPIAAVVVNSTNNQIIAQAANQDSPVGHAELIVIDKALSLIKSNRLDECDIYVTIEPCPMCAYAISKCHFNALYFGAQDVKGGGVLGENKVLNHKNLKPIDFVSHIYEAETADLLTAFFKERRK